MKIKKYVAKTMREALVEIKNELGENAIILKTRKMAVRGFPFSGPEIEVTAAVDDGLVPAPAFPEINVNGAVPVVAPEPGLYRRPRSSCIVDTARPVTITPWKPPVTQSQKRKPDVMAVSSVQDGSNLIELREDIKQLAEMVKSAVMDGGKKTGNGFDGAWGVLYKRLVDSEVKPVIAAHLVENLSRNEADFSTGRSEERIVSLLKNHFPAAGPIQCKKDGPKVVAFVGPTGAGKTTTIAKLVAHCCLGKKRRVSIITADTYRIAAIEQIRAFAEIVKVPLRTVFTHKEAATALAACVNDDIVFVDTAGRGHRDNAHIQELKDTLDALRPDEIHCVVSATTKDSDLLSILTRYRAIGADRVLFTKLDETAHVGNVFNTVSETSIPASFFTFGQSVPDDIELAQPARFVKRLWEGAAA
jgi:flagellar biosynthesis protein FlhF